MKRGVYSIIQYCPDRFRAESVNVGLVLFCPETKTIGLRMIANFDRLVAFFPQSESKVQEIIQSIKGVANRLELGVDDIKDEKGLAQFAATRANDIRMTEPRFVSIDDFEIDIERLSIRLLGAIC